MEDTVNKKLDVDKILFKGALMFERIFGNWKSLKSNEKCFYFALKAYFVLKIFKFLTRLFGHV